MKAAEALFPAARTFQAATTERLARTSSLAYRAPFKPDALERTRTFFDTYIRRNIPPFSLTRFYNHGQVPHLSTGYTPHTLDFTMRLVAINSLIHDKRSKTQNNLSPSDWQQIFETIEYGDCQHVACYVHSMLSSPHGVKQLRDLLPPVAGIIIKDDDLKRLQTLYKQEFNGQGKDLSELNEEGLFRFKRLCASNDIELRHMFNVLNLSEEVKAEMKTQSNRAIEAPYIVQPDLSDLDGAVIIDGWALQLSDQVFTACDAKKAYEHFLDDKYKLILLNSDRGLGKIFLN